MENLLQTLLDEGVDLHRSGDMLGAASRYNQVLNREPFNAGVLLLLGTVAITQGCNGLAINLLSNAISIRPEAEMYNALGCAYRFENYYTEAIAAWEKGIALNPTAEMYNNVSSVYSDHGQPELALSFIEKSLAMEPGSANAKWNRALATLTLQQWPQAWIDHENRFNATVQTTSTRRNFGCPIWDGETTGLRIAVHGEQGVGDEIMFLSMLGELIAMHKEVVVEVEPRLMDLVERSFGVTTYGNEKAMRTHEAPFDAVVPLGSLGMTFRQSNDQFPGTPYLKPDPDRVAYWRRQYQMQGPGPYIGVAWQGGSKETRIMQRSMNAKALSFCKRGTVVSLQYGQYAEAEAKKNGYLFYHESVGINIDDQAAMVAACDVIVTVAQTLVHLAGAVGTPCHVLTPLHSSWRYGQTDKMIWYGSVRLHRQKKDGDWGHPLAEVKREIDKLCRESTNANQ